MVRVSYGKITIRRAVRDVHALTLLMCLEVAGVWPKQTLASHGLAGMSSVSFSLWVSCQRLQVLLQTRYLRMDRDFVPKSRNWSLYVLDALPAYQWRTFMRMDRATYAQMELLVAPHLPKQRRTGRPLFPVDLMQKVALFSLGHYGNAASKLYPAYLMIDLFASLVGCFSQTGSPYFLFTFTLLFYLSVFFLSFSGAIGVANAFGLSVEMVVKCMRLFIRAVNKLSDTYIVWPSAERRQEQAQYAWETYGFRGCVGSADGTQIPLAYAPRVQPWTYWDRHDRYSILVLLSCDNDRNIISVTLGFTGAASDIMIQKHPDWHLFPEDHFSLLEYMLGDKGMYHTARVVGHYKAPAAELQRNKNFNWQLARLRVVAEHVAGMLKGRWMSLKELRVSIGTEEDFRWALEWIIACCVLHTVCHSLGDAEFLTATEADPPVDGLMGDDGAEECRSRVKRDVLAFMKTTGQYKY